MKNREMGIMSPIFDKIVDRGATESMKWGVARRPGDEDVIPMWVADMDFEAPPAVVEALGRRAAHGVYGYPSVPPSFWRPPNPGSSGATAGASATTGWP
jgi:cysteine-S-conjugate beta-lyase